MGATYTLAGLFPPLDQQSAKHSQIWQAIPIHTVPENMDHILSAKTQCPRYQQAYEEYLESDEIQSILTKHKSLLEYLTAHSGKTINGPCPVLTVYNTLWIEKIHNFT